VTAVVVMEKLALTALAATVTLAGTVATVVLLLDSVTMAPPAGAAVVNVTAPVDPVPPTTLVGLTVTEERLGAAATGSTVNTAEREAPPKLPEIVTAVEAATDAVVAVKIALVAPAGTVTLAGTPTRVALLLPRLTVAPAAGAAALSVAVPVEGVPPVTVEGLTASDERLRATSPNTNLVTKASPAKLNGFPLKIRSNAPGVVGKSAEWVVPVT